MTRIAVEHGVAIGVSSGNVSDFLRVARSGARRVIAMADGYTSGWDAGEVAVSAPVLEAVMRAASSGASTPYRAAPTSAEPLFDAGRAAFLEATETHAGERPRGDGAQLTTVEIEGSRLRLTWLARMELSLFRDGVVHRITRESPALAIERFEQQPSHAELAIAPGDLVTLSCRRWVGTWMDHARSDLLASLAEPTTSPEELVRGTIRRWTARQKAEQASGDPYTEFRLVVAAVRI